jgi:hypothetical protein
MGRQASAESRSVPVACLRGEGGANRSLAEGGVSNLEEVWQNNYMVDQALNGVVSVSDRLTGALKSGPFMRGGYV